MNALAKCLFVTLLCASAAPAEAADADISQWVPACDGCHGHNGVSAQPTVPTIAGIDAGITADAIYRFKDGVYPCPSSPMCLIVTSISSDQAEALGAHYAALPFVAAKQPFDAAKAARGAAIHAAQCEQCHSRGGSDPADQASLLAGQWMPYLSVVLADYAAGKREQLEAMRVRLTAMSREDLDALANYYASATAAGQAPPTP
jgi:sulfide dehydrogenase cytochrome subunit